MSEIHDTVVIEDGAELGNNISIGPFCHIEKDAKIGNDCVLGSHVTIMNGTTIGNNCKIHAGAVIGDVPQDTGFSGGDSFAKVGDNCILREGVTIHRGTKEGTCTLVGNNCFLMAFSHLAHNVEIGENVIIANGALLAGYVEVGDRAFVSGNVVIHQFTKVGRLCMLAGGCAISKDLPPYCTTHPVTLNTVAGLNLVGMRRAGMSADEIKSIKDGYGILFLSGLNKVQALEELEKRITSGPAQDFAAFINKSTRGLCKTQS